MSGEAVSDLAVVAEAGWDRRNEVQLAAVARIGREAMPRLLRLRYELLSGGFRPCGAVLPDHLNPDPGGDDADSPATIMRLPVTWGDRIALIVEA